MNLHTRAVPSPSPNTCRTELKFSPFSPTFANAYRPKFWGHQEDTDVTSMQSLGYNSTEV